MTVSDYVTRLELDQRAQELHRDIRDTERLLRDRDDETERVLRAEFVATIRASEERTHARFDKIDDHLERQDSYLIRRRLVWPTWRRDTASLLTSAVVAAVVLRLVFHIG